MKGLKGGRGLWGSGDGVSWEGGLMDVCGCYCCFFVVFPCVGGFEKTGGWVKNNWEMRRWRVNGCWVSE